MIKYYKTENGYVSSIGIVEGVEVSKDEFDTEIERIQKEQEKEPVPPTIEEQILALQNALISQKISGGIKVTDSARLPVIKFSMWGKTEQVQTTGANLFDQNLLLDLTSPNYNKELAGSGLFYYKIPVNKTVTVSVQNHNMDGEYLLVNNIPGLNGSRWLSHKTVITSSSPKSVSFEPKDGYIYLGVNITVKAISNMLQKTGGIMINHGSVAMPYEPYTGGKPSPSPDYSQPIEVTPQGIITVDFTDGTNHQIVELSCPREFTKWDRLEKIDGVWNWIFQSNKKIINEKTDFDTNTPQQQERDGIIFTTSFPDASGGNQTSLCDKFKNLNYIYGGSHKEKYGYYCDHVSVEAKYFRPPNESIQTLEQWKAWLTENPIEIQYKTKEPELIPLALFEQDKLNALTMYTPTTEITNDGGCNMELTYTVDTKSYVDTKIAEISKAML